ncbi:DAO-domain-containing protein [Caulochytrium protostelioides]|uniref:DAO-domain-containing protein n=1 Tax=Caulochytrium protostelioides TaxID=1555241 RepID=A0A4P9X0U1_9FUNG|nr:DAO-domain-containing protein [Caulochytrium protostelioides]
MAATIEYDLNNSTSGRRLPVWDLRQPFDSIPRFQPLKTDLPDVDVLVIGAGIAGLSTAHDLLERGRSVVVIDDGEIISGETGRTTAHLSSNLGAGYPDISSHRGKEAAKHIAGGHSYAIARVEELAKRYNIDCEYRRLNGYMVCHYPRNHEKYDESFLKEELKAAGEAGLDVSWQDHPDLPGFTGLDPGAAVVYHGQGTFHPTKYLVGLVKAMQQKWPQNLRIYTHTRAFEINDGDSPTVKTSEGLQITAKAVVEATNTPLQKLAIVAKFSPHRTYAVAFRLAPGHEYLIVGGCDHPVGSIPKDGPEAPFKHLLEWTHKRYPDAGEAVYQWSGQVIEPADHVAYIGENVGNKNVDVVTGDAGNGLTHGVLAGRLLADQITGKAHPWQTTFAAHRNLSGKPAVDAGIHNVKIQAAYAGLARGDVSDIEDILPGTGAVLGPLAAKGAPRAVYRDDDGKVYEFSAVCPHLQGPLKWNPVEKSWDCPAHGSRFSCKGMLVQGPAKGDMTPK